MSNNKQQTAVEWGIEKLASLTFDYMAGFISKREYDQLSKGVIRQAKEMEKEQMWKYIKINYCIGHRSLEFHRLEFEQYYNETYGDNK
jgi:hypothetical protein